MATYAAGIDPRTGLPYPGPMGGPDQWRPPPPPNPMLDLEGDSGGGGGTQGGGYWGAGPRPTQGLGLHTAPGYMPPPMPQGGVYDRGPRPFGDTRPGMPGPSNNGGGGNTPPPWQSPNHPWPNHNIPLSQPLPGTGGGPVKPHPGDSPPWNPNPGGGYEPMPPAPPQPGPGGGNVEPEDDGGGGVIEPFPIYPSGPVKPHPGESPPWNPNPGGGGGYGPTHDNGTIASKDLMLPKGGMWRPPAPPNPMVPRDPWEGNPPLPENRGTPRPGPNPWGGTQGGGGFARPPFPGPAPAPTAAYTALGADPLAQAGNQYNPDKRVGQEDYNAMFSGPAAKMPEGLDDYEKQVWETRQKAWAATPKLNYFNTNFQSNSDTAQQRFWKGLQSGKGIPTADAQQEYRRMRLRGVQR